MSISVVVDEVQTLLKKLNRYFQVGTTPRAAVVLEVSGPLQGRKRSTCSNVKINVMNTRIKIVKKDSRAVLQVADVSSSRTSGSRTTENIVKSWIRESRDRRLALVVRLRDSIRWK